MIFNTLLVSFSLLFKRQTLATGRITYTIRNKFLMWTGRVNITLGSGNRQKEDCHEGKYSVEYGWRDPEEH